MTSISSVGHNLAMDGQNIYKAYAEINSSAKSSGVVQEKISPTSSDVATSIAQNNASVKEDAQQLQRMSDMVMTQKLQFNVNKELNTVVVKVVDPKTDQVLKEIPSEDIQKLKLNIRKAIGLMFDNFA